MSELSIAESTEGVQTVCQPRIFVIPNGAKRSEESLFRFLMTCAPSTSMRHATATKPEKKIPDH
jgi:hypothetical protein